jgi:hypothetical protein
LTALRRKHKPLRKRVAFTNSFIEKAKKKKQQLSAYYDGVRVDLERKELLLRETEESEAQQWHNGLATTLKRIAAMRRKLRDDENDKLSSLSSNSLVRSITAQITALDRAETDELAHALRNLQAIHMQTYLQQVSLATAVLPGIGDKMKARLCERGFKTAWDIGPISLLRVPGIGPRRIRALEQWRGSLEARARATCPSSLDPQYAESIRARRRAERALLEANRKSELSRMQGATDAITIAFAAKDRELINGEQQARLQVSTQLAAIKSKYATPLSSLREGKYQNDDEHVEKLAQVDKLIAQAHKQLYDLSRQTSAAARETQSFLNITFPAYLPREFSAFPSSILDFLPLCSLAAKPRVTLSPCHLVTPSRPLFPAAD